MTSDSFQSPLAEQPEPTPIVQRPLFRLRLLRQTFDRCPGAISLRRPMEIGAGHCIGQQPAIPLA